jgi:quinoprotein glucose dehydrogenase
VLPGFDGGGEWGGSAVDRETGVLYVNANDVPWISALEPIARPGGIASGASVYLSSCASCHGANRRGDGDRSPSVLDVAGKLSAIQIRDVIDHGRGFMPAFATLPLAERDAVTAYLLGLNATVAPANRASADTTRATDVHSPYRFRGYEKWKDANGYPATRPPWGTLSAIDLNTGDYLWRVPLGEFADLKAKGMAPTGTEQYGGPIVTAGGIVFIGATQDEKFHALDKRSGAVLWETSLPAAGYATPSTYMVRGRQYVVIAAGGGKLGTKSSDAYVAFALRR